MTNPERELVEGFSHAQLNDDPILKHFAFKHLPPHLRTVSVLFFELVHQVLALTPRCAERSAALRKLLEAKDCAVRSAND